MYGHVLVRPWQGQRPSTFKKKDKTKRFLPRSCHNVCFDRFHVNDPSWFVLNTFCARNDVVVIIIYGVLLLPNIAHLLLSHF